MTSSSPIYAGRSAKITAKKNNSRSSPQGEEELCSCLQKRQADDSDIRGTEALGCLYVCVRSCVGVVVVIMLAMLMNVM